MTILGIIGGGQLGYMLCESALQIEEIKSIYIYSDKNDIPCNLLQDNDKINIIYGSYTDKEFFYLFCNKCDLITYEFENIDIQLLQNVTVPIYPSINYLKIIQDKYVQKEYLYNNGLFVGPFRKIETIDNIYTFIDEYNYPIIIKKRKGSFDGRGNQVIKNKEELLLWERETNNIQNYYIENYIDFDNELSICGCKSNNKIIYYEPVKNTHKQNILLKTQYHENMIDNTINKKIKEIYTKILQLFNTKGVICVELFQKGDEIYINEIALRVHNSYHISLDCCNLSQFEMHIRSIIDLKIVEPKFIYNGEMYNIISNMQPYNSIINKLNNKTIIIKKYNKKEIGIRKVGHINVVKKI